MTATAKKEPVPASQRDLRVFAGNSQYGDSNYMIDKNKPLEMDGAGRPLDPREGDLYCDRGMAQELQFIVSIPETKQSARATHVYKDGEWATISDGNYYVGLKIPDAKHYGDPTYAAHRAIERGLYATAAGRLLSREAQRELIDSVLLSLGLGELRSGRDDAPLELDLTGSIRIKKAVKELLTWAPDGYPDQIGEAGAEYDGVGFAKDAEHYKKYLNGEDDGFGEEGHGRVLPLLSQPVYYAVVGSKGEGRTVNGLLEELKQAAGLTDEEIYGEDD